MREQFESESILIIEDNIAENILAQAEAIKVGFKKIFTATDLSEGLKIISENNPDYVLSDLFFPAGEKQEELSKDFLPYYENFCERRFKQTGDINIVLKAIEACAEIFGVTPEKYAFEIMPKLGGPEKLTKASQDAIKGVKDLDKYNKFQTIIDNVKRGVQIASGIEVSKVCQETKIKCAIVTSTYHHDDAFEPISNLIKVPYVDTLGENGSKDWKKGLQILLN